MNTKNLIKLFLLIALTGVSMSCSFLDTMPDQRTEITNATKVRDLLISAYPTLHPMIMGEYMSDNYTDNGDIYGSPMNLVAESYYWEDPVETDWDSPQEVWDACYKAIATANQVLEGIEELGTPEDCLGYKAEALLCRAYCHFVLANTFCMAYSESSGTTDLGIPYITSPEKQVGVVYERGTIAQVYENINKDIEDALPFIDKAKHDVQMYHFNKKAAYAFAARFNLYYGKDFDKVIAYATEAIGSNPTTVLRNLDGYTKFTTPKEWTYGYINGDEPANLLLITNRSFLGRSLNERYGTTRQLASQELFWSAFPGGSLSVYSTIFGNDQMLYIPKMVEIFEITDQIAQTGQPHVVLPAFTTDEALLCRAEAYVMKHEYDLAATDLSYWYVIKGASARSAQQISDFYANGSETTICKPLNPKFEIEAGMQTNMLQAVLHARRVEGMGEGTRWQDIKRYGIEIKHAIYHGETMVLQSYDLRKAIQIPVDVLAAPGGMTPNPR